MRISTTQMQQRAVERMLDQETQLSKTQQQVASGRRMLEPADDPAGAAQAMSLSRVISLTQQHQANADSASARQTNEEGVLSSVTDLLQSMSTLVVQGNNDTNSASDRQAIATQLQQELNHLLDLANSKDANGEYLFSGYQSHTEPFTQDGSGTVTYQGDNGQRMLNIGSGVQIAMTDPGDAIFQDIPAGNGVFTAQAAAGNTGTGVITPGSATGSFSGGPYSVTFTQTSPNGPVTFQVLDKSESPPAEVTSGDYTSGADIDVNGAQVSVSGSPANWDTFTIAPSGNQDVFTTVNNLIDTFNQAGDDPVSRTALHNTVNSELTNLQNALQNVLLVRARVGSRLDAADSQKNTNAALILSAQTTLSNVQDLDYAQAASQLQLQLTGLQAAQQTYLSVAKLSLFNYI
jgi:flagellar hook-associated protein 3 FlgL